jgi:hypothetical protein
MNYFELLGIDPDARWDQKEFEQLLQQKQKDWSILSNGVGPKAVQSQQYLNSLSDIRAVMSDPERRRTYLATERQQQITERKAQLRREIGLYNAQKSITQTELDKFYEAHADIATKEEIEAELHVDIRPANPEITEVLPRIETSTLNDIDHKLTILNKASLYDLLNLPQTADGRELCAASRNLYEEAVQSLATTKKELAGLAQTIFSSPEKREQYDARLRQNILDKFCKELDIPMGRKRNPVLPDPWKQDFLEKASAAGCSQGEAFDRLLKYAVQKGWILHPESIDKDTQRRRNSTRLRDLIRRKYYFTAQQELTELKPDMLDEQERQSYQGEIAKALRRAQQKFAPAKASTIFSSREERISRCREALSICVDCQEARELLSQLLPIPRNFQAYADGNVVVLSWEPPAPDMHCRIIRKYFTAPVSETDGQLLVTSAEGNYEDSSVEVGVPVYYAAFTVCEDVVSFGATSPREPLLVMADVTDVQLHVHSGRIELTWCVPSNLHNLIVRRKEDAAPSSIHEGKAIALQDMKHVIDDHVQNNVIYYYQIYCQFKDHKDDIKTTSGITVPATLGTQADVVNVPVEEVSNLTYLQLGASLRLQWQWPRDCQGVNVTYHHCSLLRDRTLVTRRITREEYEYFGYYDIECMMGQEYTIVLATVFEQGDKQIVSPGIEIVIYIEDWAIIEYEIKKKIYSRQRYLVLHTKTRVKVPPFRLVYQRHRLPFTKDDGELVYSSPETILLDGELHLSIGERTYPPDTFSKLFLEDEWSGGRVRFRLLNREKSRLG